MFLILSLLLLIRGLLVAFVILAWFLLMLFMLALILLVRGLLIALLVFAWLLLPLWGMRFLSRAPFFKQHPVLSYLLLLGLESLLFYAAFAFSVSAGFVGLLWFTFPLIGALFWKKLPFFYRRLPLSFFMAVLVGGMLYVGVAWLTDLELERALHKFDLNGDGAFSESEETPEMQKAMKRLTSDTGRTFALFVALPVTAVWYSVLFGLLGVAGGIRRKFFGSQSPLATK